MSEAHRQHPVAAITNMLQIIRDNFITILVLVFVGTSGNSYIGPYFIFGLILLGLIGGVVSWVRFTYQVVDGELRIERGIFVRKKLYMSAGHIQVIDISAGVVQRIFGLVAVEVKTAGSSSKEAKISAVTRTEADRIKTLLRESAVDVEEEEPDQPFEASKLYALNIKDLLIAASSSGSFGIALSIVGGVFSQVDQIIDEEQMLNFFESAVPVSVGVNMVLSVTIFLLIVAWILSFAGTFIKYYGFTLTVKEDEMLITRGLFEQRQITVPFNRIQAIQVKEELLRQPFGYASVVLESAGYGEEQQNSTTLFPLLKKEKVGDFIRHVIPEYEVKTIAIKPPAVAMRRYLLRMVWVSLAVILPVWFFIPYGAFSWLLLIPALLLGYAQYRDAQIGMKENSLVISSRLLSRTTAVVKKYRVQSSEIKENPFQRRLGLVTYAVTVASGNSGQTFSIRELNNEDGTKFLEWLSESPVKTERLNGDANENNPVMD